MKQLTAEVELTAEKQALALKLIDRTNRLGDEISMLQSLLKLGGYEEREEQLLHDELDVVRDYREITLERIALLTLGDLSKQPTPNDPDYQPAGLGTLDSDAEDGWEVAREAMFNASKK
jgi:hypothetical protein